ncbi:unnamed protein product [Didymodactylos carnosus]|uniref:Uncharacterized protein n=1 Tax=Didymodactylos carnosus TaxID=1234261 RepID=A0A8S2X558_9BILA|nr:unnamed protein product [Didymodactylos carnosus]CAF4474962.1 unnamed protein product [Didymodactylos carnosus]
MLNNALENQNADITYKVCYFTKARHWQVAQLYLENNTLLTKITVTPGSDGITDAEFKTLQEKSGRLLYFNKVFSTSSDEYIALTSAPSPWNILI